MSSPDFRRHLGMGWRRRTTLFWNSWLTLLTFGLLPEINMTSNPAARRALEDPENPAHALIDFIIEHDLPYKTVATLAGVLPQSLYHWSVTDNVRISDAAAERVCRLLETLRKLEAAGHFPLAGSSHERAAKLHALTSPKVEVESSPT